MLSMKQSFYYRGHQEKEIFAQKWDVENNSAKGVVQIAPMGWPNILDATNTLLMY